MKMHVKGAFVAYNPEYYQANKEKYAAKSKAWREKNPERAKENRRRNYLENKERALKYSTEYNRRRKIGISPEEYDKLLEKQNGVCAICNLECTRALAADHCHITKKIRGLLCNNCNRGLGHFKDNPTILRRAIVYLNIANKTNGPLDE